MKRSFITSLTLALFALSANAAPKSIVMIAGKPSHGPAQHEHNAGVQLLAKALKQNTADVDVKIHLNAEWPSAEELGKADTILIYSDGGGGHPALQGDHLDQLGKEMKRGAGFVCLHYAVEPTTEKGNKEFIDWLGGCFETHWSVNPHWDGDFKEFPRHPISSGVKPFMTNDEWYFHMRFRKDMKSITPILSAVAPDSTMGRPDGTHSGNPAVREAVKNKVPQHTAWAVQRDDGGRGFGFTGGHFHRGWGNDDQRKLVLNAILWTAKAEVPANGVESKITEEDLKANLDPKAGQGLPEKKKPEVKPAAAPAPAPAKAAAKGNAKPYGIEAARAAMADFKTPKGLAATLFAAEPMVQNPTNIDIDPKGRIWTVECVNYRRWGNNRPEGDRVVILQDTNGDGEADKEITFFQSKELVNPLGLCVLPMAGGKGTQAIVSASGKLWLLTDADGDDKAEKAEVLLKVGGGVDHDHHLHAVTFGPDGKFYFNFGNSGSDLSNPDGTPVTDLMGNVVNNSGKPYRQGMIFRCDIDLAKAKLSNVETLAHNFRNNYKVCVDSLGGMWQSDNDDDGNKGVRINAIVDYGSYGYTDEITGAGWNSPRTNIEKEIPLKHWHQNDPGTIPNLLQTGSGSPTGICVNESSLLGAQFRNEVIHCDAGPRTVRAYPVKKVGAGYTAEMVDILTTEDTWYRPSDVAIAPDGSLFVADWYDPGVGGHNMQDNDPATMRGRVYRVAPEKHAYKISAPDFSNAAGCMEALKSSNNSTRFVAWQKLATMLEGKPVTKKQVRDNDGNKITTFKMGDKDVGMSEAEAELVKLWQSENVRQRARALSLLMRVPGKGRSYLDKALTDENPDIRVAAVRELRLMAAAQYLGKPAEGALNLLLDGETAAEVVLSRAKKEENKQVLRELATTLRVSRDPTREKQSAKVEIAKASTPKEGEPKPAEVEKKTVELVNIPFADQTPKAWAALAQKHDGKDRWYLEALGIGATTREEACLKAWLAVIQEDWNTPTGRDLVWRLRTPASFEYLSKILTSKKTDAETAPRYLRAFDFLPDGEPKNNALLAVLSSGSAPKTVSNDLMQRVSKTSLKDSPEAKKALDAMLSSVKGKAELIQAVKDFSIAGKDVEVLDAALSDSGNPLALEGVKMLLKTPEGRELLTTTLGGDKAEKLANVLGGSGDKQAINLLSGILTKAGSPAPLRTAAVKALALSASGAEALIELASGNKFPEELKGVASQALALVQYPGISERAVKLFPAPASADGKALPPIAELVKLKGDAKKGQALFLGGAGGCIGCHRVGDKGIDFAPALTEIGTKFGKDVIYDSMINPNAGVSMGFETWQITMKNGQLAMGLIRGETNEAVTLVLPGGVTSNFEKKQITEKKKLTISMMPAGLQAMFTQDDLVNLVEYLSSLKAASVKK
jgi:putative membrane-bound dehydrogenase-like protein